MMNTRTLGKRAPLNTHLLNATLLSFSYKKLYNQFNETNSCQISPTVEGVFFDIISNTHETQNKKEISLATPPYLCASTYIHRRQIVRPSLFTNLLTNYLVTIT